MHPQEAFTAISSAAVAIAAAIAVILTIKKGTKSHLRYNRSRKTSKFRRAAFLCPAFTDMQTPWDMILSCGKENDFLLSLSVTRLLFLDKLLPVFFTSENGSIGSVHIVKDQRQKAGFLSKKMWSYLLWDYGALRKSRKPIVGVHYLAWSRLIWLLGCTTVSNWSCGW